jgi:hypothetical protein
MKCPHCCGTVSLFRTKFSRGGQRDKCPHCGASVRTIIRHKGALLLGLGVALLLAPMSAMLSAVYGHLLIAASAFIAAAVGVVALTKFELVPGESGAPLGDT